VYHCPLSHIIMQNPTDPQAEASIPTDTTVTNNGSNWNRTVNIRRKAAKRTLPFELTAEELELVSPPQGEDIPARKKPRLEEPFSTTSDEATRETASPDVSVWRSPHPAGDNDTNAHPVTDTQPNAGATPVTGSWTLQEDAKLTRAVANTPKKKWGKEYKTNWPAVAALVPGRTRGQCFQRWPDVLDASINRASGRKSKWTAVEDSKLKDAVQTHGGKDWGAISALIPCRTQRQCYNRWHNGLDPSIDRASGRKGKWTAVEDSTLKHAVQTHGDKEWSAIAALVPGRATRQCWHRWHSILDPNICLASRRKGKWTAVEDRKLKDAVQTQGDKDWVAVSALVPGRMRNQCLKRWNETLKPSIGGASARKGHWTTENEDSQLKHALQKQGDKDWAVIAELVPGRTKYQCWQRWRYKKHMDSNGSTVQGKEHGTLKKAPGLGQNPHSP
jgi:hypothetical protein